MNSSPAGAGRAGVSEALRRFVAEFPYERGPLLKFVTTCASELPPGSRVLDVGAGDAPYRELFSHVTYMTSDWEQSPHEGAKTADIVASAEELGIGAGSFDAVLCTQVLEHVPDPATVLAELFRVLRPGGPLYLTAPLVWELHELPYDYFRYTSEGLSHLLCETGFAEVVITARNDSFATIAQLVRNLEFSMGRASDGLNDDRERTGRLLRELSDALGALAPLDVNHSLPLGYTVRATKPEPRTHP